MLHTTVYIYIYKSHTAWHTKTKFIEDAQKHSKFSNYLTHIFYLCLGLNISEMYLNPKLADTVLPEPKHIQYIPPLLPLFFPLPPSLWPFHTHSHIHYWLWITRMEKKPSAPEINQKEKQTKILFSQPSSSAPQKKVAATIIPANYLRPPQASPVSTVTHGNHSRSPWQPESKPSTSVSVACLHSDSANYPHYWRARAEAMRTLWSHDPIMANIQYVWQPQTD